MGRLRPAPTRKYRSGTRAEPESIKEPHYSRFPEEILDLPRGLTTPVEAKEYVEATGIDILAPAVGNMHGMLKSMVQGPKVTYPSLGGGVPVRFT